MDHLTKCLTDLDATPPWLYEHVSKFSGEPAIISFDCDTLRCHQWLLGHHATDKQLVRVADLLKKAFPDGEVFRIDGDGFLVLASMEFAAIKFLEDTVDILVDTGAFAECNYEQKHSLLERILVFLRLRSPTAETAPPAFTVSVCASSFETPRTVERMLAIHEENVAKIARKRYANLDFVDPESKYPPGQTAVVIHDA